MDDGGRWFGWVFGRRWSATIDGGGNGNARRNLLTGLNGRTGRTRRTTRKTDRWMRAPSHNGFRFFQKRLKKVNLWVKPMKRQKCGEGRGLFPLLFFFTSHLTWPASRLSPEIRSFFCRPFDNARKETARWIQPRRSRAHGAPRLRFVSWNFFEKLSILHALFSP